MKISDIENIKGVGPKITQKIIQTYQDYDNFKESIENYEIDKLMNIQGLSNKKALEIAQYILGYGENNFIKTRQAQKIYDEIIDTILKFANTTYAKNRIRLMMPTNNIDMIKDTNKLIIDTLNETEDLDYNYISKLYANIKPLDDDINPSFDDTYAIICEDYDDYLEFIKRGYNKYTDIYPIEDHPNIDDYEFILYVYNEFLIEPPSGANIISIKNTAEEYEIQPNSVLEYYIQNLKILENVYTLRKYLKKDSIIGDVINTIKSINPDKENIKPIETTVEEIKDEADAIINAQIKQINLVGDEVLQLLNADEDMPPKIMKIYKDVLNDACQKLADETGILFDPFIIQYPLKIDYNEIKRVNENMMATIHLNEYEKKINACSILSECKKQIIDEVDEIIHYDYQFALAAFYKKYDLSIAEIGDKYILDGALHLKLKEDEIENDTSMQPVMYNFDDENNIILLTGANSGGKTTLLETLAQLNIMAHMGIGVCAKSATIAHTDEVYYFTKRQSLNAGAFETFLKSFIPTAVGDMRKLILIDELESITELEAAIKIITGFIQLIEDKDNYAIIVTHMAPEILKQTKDLNIRVDGIEAKGLDENYNLIVDRNPRINYLAKSTPELILKRVYEKSQQPQKDIYKKILDKF